MLDALFPMLAQAQYDDGGGAVGLIGCLVYLVLIVLVVAGGWKMFAKAGEPGWAIIVPIYNLYIMTKIAGRPAWWIVLMLIPLVQIIAAIIVCIDLARAFGKGTGFGIGLALLGFIFVPILGFGDATYQGQKAE